jgi:uncharacterized membrane protein
MNDTWFKIKIGTKLSLIGLVILFIGLFILENNSTSVDVWIFKVYHPTVLELLVAVFLFGVIVTLLAKPTYHTFRQIGELRTKKVAPELNPPQPKPESAPPAQPPVVKP